MVNLFSRATSVAPLGYVTPTFPSLYLWPSASGDTGHPSYLYNLHDIWRFTTYWSLIAYGAFHLAAGLWAFACAVQASGMPKRSRTDVEPALGPRQKGKERYSAVDGNEDSLASSPRDAEARRTNTVQTQHALTGTRSWLPAITVPWIYLAFGSIEAFVSGSIVGLIIGAVYNAGNFHMSTWIPFVWGLINILVLVLSSFSVYGGL